MNNNLLNNQEFQSKNEKVFYWVVLWEELIENYNDKSYGLELNNPQLLLMNILNEIEANQFKNKENKKYFIEQLGFFIKNDPAIIKKFNSEFTHILKKLQSNDYFYLKLLCSSVQKIFHNGDYFNELFTELKTILMSSKWKKSDDNLIKIISQHLITELLLKGFELKDISSLPRNLFDTYRLHNDIVLTDFPTDTKSDIFFKENKFDKENYNDAIKKEIDSLTIDNRLSYFVNYFSEIKKKYYVIHQIANIKSININHSFGPILLYSPNTNQIIKRPQLTEEYKKITSMDIFQNDNSELFFGKKENNLINASIKVEAYNLNSAKAQAQDIMDKLLDFLGFYFKPKYKLSYSPHSIILNEEFREISFNITNNRKLDLSDWPFFLELNKISEDFATISKSIGDIIFKPSNELLEIELKILQAIHWYRKGCDAIEDEDKLLNFWILIENFVKQSSKLSECCKSNNNNVSKFEIIKEIIPALEILSFSYSFGWESHSYLLHKYINRHLGSIPNDIVEKCYLSPTAGTTINLIEVLNNLSDLKNYIQQKIVKDKIIFTENFFFKSDFASEYLKNQIEEIKTDILLIYRLRNKIVHNAEYNDTMLSIYVQKAKQYSGKLLSTIISEYSINENISLDDILMQQIVESNELLIKLKINKSPMINIIS